MKVTSKQDMYQRLARGEFGNTIPQYFSVQEWLASGDAERYSQWGVRSSKVSGHPACRLYVGVDEVASYVRENFLDGVNISMMVDAVAGVTSMIHVAEIDGQGLIVDGVIDPPKGSNWRIEMASPRRKQYSGITAHLILRRYLNENALSDLFEVLEKFPGGVVELSTLDRCIGDIPHRNAIVWETRHY